MFEAIKYVFRLVFAFRIHEPFLEGLVEVDVETPRALIAMNPEEKKGLDGEGTLLHRAARDSQLNVVKFLVKALMAILL